MTNKPEGKPSKQVPIEGQPGAPSETRDNVEIAIESAITKYGPAVALAVCIVVIVGAGIAFWVQRNRNIAGETWSTVVNNFQARDVKGLVTAAENARSSKAGTVAMLNAGAVELNDGLERLLKDKVKAREDINAAIEKIQQARNSEFADGMIKDQATYSLAFAYESMGEFDKAQTFYQELADNPDSQFQHLAADGLARCGDPETKEFYEVFAKWEPTANEEAPEELDLLKNPLDLSPPEALDLNPGSQNEGDQDAAPSLPETDPTGDGAQQETGTDSPESNQKDGTETSASGTQEAGTQEDGTQSEAGQNETGGDQTNA